MRTTQPEVCIDIVLTGSSRVDPGVALLTLFLRRNKRIPHVLLAVITAHAISNLEVAIVHAAAVFDLHKLSAASVSLIELHLRRKFAPLPLGMCLGLRSHAAADARRDIAGSTCGKLGQR
jgi:hypothetical protein